MLTIEPENTKALYRRASANSALSRPELARRDLEAVIRAEPANRAAAAALGKLQYTPELAYSSSS